MKRAQVPISPARRWLQALDKDSDLASVGVVLTPEKLTEIRAHNTALAKASLKAAKVANGRKSAATRARRRAVRP